MAKDKVYAIPNITTPNRPVIFNSEICNGCNHVRGKLFPGCLYSQSSKGKSLPSSLTRMNAGTAAAA